MHPSSLELPKNNPSLVYVETDKDISRSLLEKLFEFISSDTKIPSDDIHKSCRSGLQVIKTHRRVIVIDDEAKISPEMIAWEKTLKLTGRQTLHWMTKRDVATLKAKGEVSIKILLVAQSAFEALKRYSKELERLENPAHHVEVKRSVPKKIQPIPQKPTLSRGGLRHEQLLRELAAGAGAPTNRIQKGPLQPNHTTQETPVCGCLLC